MTIKVDANVKEMNGQTATRSDTWQVNTVQDALNQFNTQYANQDVTKVTFQKV